MGRRMTVVSVRGICNSPARVDSGRTGIDNGQSSDTHSRSAATSTHPMLLASTDPATSIRSASEPDTAARRPFRRGLVWFRRDLRVVDHVALHHALAQCETVFCVFVFDPAILDPLARSIHQAGHRRVAFLYGCVAALASELEAAGSGLMTCHDRPVSAIPELVRKWDIDAVFFNADVEPAAIARDQSVMERLQAMERVCFTFKDHVVMGANEVLTAQGKPFSVFTPYKNAWLRTLRPQDLEPYDIALRASNDLSPVDLPTLAQLGFSDGIESVGVAPGNAAGSALLEDFLERIDEYHVRRDFPSVRGPSYLSAHLRFGTVSIRTLAANAHQRMLAGSKGAEVWLNELIWRDFYAMILAQHPRLAAGESFRPEYDRIQWATGPEADMAFGAWCEGRTGYPLVDAAMRQLNSTGYMHNRLRMITASFLCKDLGIDWRRGEAYFAAQLTDYDLASNNGGWQWAASSGCDAQPYFRIFNPVTQSTRFDPAGKFIRRYIPELAQLSDKVIHAPWQASADVLTAAAVEIGKTYPPPIVNHALAREHTLERYKAVKSA
jgi:deoxyribodipyrimidine photo-lyase